MLLCCYTCLFLNITTVVQGGCLHMLACRRYVCVCVRACVCVSVDVVVCVSLLCVGMCVCTHTGRGLRKFFSFFFFSSSALDTPSWMQRAFKRVFQRWAKALLEAFTALKVSPALSEVTTWCLFRNSYKEIIGLQGETKTRFPTGYFICIRLQTDDGIDTHTSYA